MQQEFWSDTGPTSGDGETSARFLPTPAATDSTPQASIPKAGRTYKTASGNIRRITSTGSNFGLGLAKTAAIGELTSYVVDSPARTSLTPAKVRAYMESVAASSLKPFAWLENSSLDTFYWRTSQRCLAGGWIPYSESWPRLGMLRNGTVYRLPPLARRTSGTGSSSWPTPIVGDAEKCPSESLSRAVRPDLPFSHWPTPAANSMKQSNVYKRGNPTLKGAVQMFPTPTATERSGVNPNCPERVQGLSDAVKRKMFPTPRARDWKDNGPNLNLYRDERQDTQLGVRVKRLDPTGGSLNPTWVEWLMGFPSGWTDLSASETQ